MTIFEKAENSFKEFCKNSATEMLTLELSTERACIRLKEIVAETVFAAMNGDSKKCEELRQEAVDLFNKVEEMDKRRENLMITYAEKKEALCKMANCYN